MFISIFIVFQLSQVALGTVGTPAIDRPVYNHVVINHSTFQHTTINSASNTHIEPGVSKVKTRHHNETSSSDTIKAATYPTTSSHTTEAVTYLTSSIPHPISQFISKPRRKRSFDPLNGCGYYVGELWSPCLGSTTPMSVVKPVVTAFDRPCGPCDIRVQGSGRCVFSHNKCGGGHPVRVTRTRTRTRTRTLTRTRTRTRTVTRRFW